MPLVPTSRIAAAVDEIAIPGRVLSNGKDLTPALARHLLQLRFGDEGSIRIHELADRNRQGALSPEEQEKLANYVLLPRPISPSGDIAICYLQSTHQAIEFRMWAVRQWQNFR